MNFPKIIDYKILIPDSGYRSLESFEEKVKDHIKDGWIPYGSASMSTLNREGSMGFSQTMVKIESESL